MNFSRNVTYILFKLNYKEKFSNMYLLNALKNPPFLLMHYLPCILKIILRPFKTLFYFYLLFFRAEYTRCGQMLLITCNDRCFMKYREKLVSNFL